MTKYALLNIELKDDKHCNGCIAVNYDFNKCKILDRSLAANWEFERPEWCPLVEQDKIGDCTTCLHESKENDEEPCIGCAHNMWCNWEPKK